MVLRPLCCWRCLVGANVPGVGAASAAGAPGGAGAADAAGAAGDASASCCQAPPCLALICLDKLCEALPTLAKPGQSMTALLGLALANLFIDVQRRALPRAAS